VRNGIMTTTMNAPPDEQLENGMRPATPAGDNLLTDFSRAEATAYWTVARAGGGRIAVDDDLGLTVADSGSASPFGNVAHLSRPITAARTEALVSALRGGFAGGGGPFLLWSPWPTADLGPHGFQLMGHPPLMVRPPRDDDAAPLVPGLRIVEVRTRDALRDFEKTITEAYPAPEQLPFGSRPRLFSDGLLDSNWHFYVGYEEARPVATAASFVGDGVVVVEGVSTRAECRGRGYGAALTAAATVTACDRPAALVASDLGRGVYADLGYVPILRYTLWLGTR
jgi:hypothetical protein